MRPLNANMACDNIAQAYTMVAVCDTALRFHPPPDIDGWIRSPTASNGTQPHTMAPLPTLTAKKFVQNYEDMPAAIRAFIRWFLSHEGRRFYVMNPIMANYIEGTTKYDRLTAIDHHQHDLTRRLCSTSMFSLAICIASSEHQHWIHASNSLCSFLASEYAFTAPPDSSIIDPDAIAFRTMNYQLDTEKAEIDYDSEGDFLTLSVTSMTTQTRRNWTVAATKTRYQRWKISTSEPGPLITRRGTPIGDAQHRARAVTTLVVDAIFDTTVVDGVEYNLEGESHNGTRTLVRYVGSADATRKLSKDRKMRDAIHSRQSSLRSLLTTTLTQWLRAPTVAIAQTNSIAACVNNWITNFAAHTALTKLWMAQVADVSLRTAIIVGLVYEQYNTYLADLLQAWRLHLPYYPNHVMFIEFSSDEHCTHATTPTCHLSYKYGYSARKPCLPSVS